MTVKIVEVLFLNAVLHILAVDTGSQLHILNHRGERFTDVSTAAAWQAYTWQFAILYRMWKLSV